MQPRILGTEKRLGSYSLKPSDDILQVGLAVKCSKFPGFRVAGILINREPTGGKVPIQPDLTIMYDAVFPLLKCFWYHISNVIKFSLS